MPGRIDFTMGFKTREAVPRQISETGFRIYILGNLSGCPDLSWHQRKIRKIDIDNFDRVMAEIIPALDIGSGSKLQFQTIDGFQPDVWLEKIKILDDLQTLKRELSNPRTAAQAAAKIQAFLPDASNDRVVQPEEATESREEMLERLLGKRPESPIGRTDALDTFIQNAVAPHVTKEADPQHQALINLIDAAMSQFLRSLLHRRDFQALEALWRATEALVNEESAEGQSIFLVDISQAELLAEQRTVSHAFEQKLLQHVQTGDSEQDVVLIGNYIFSDTADDRDLLAFCSQLAEECGGAFLGGAGHKLIENIQEGGQYLKEMHADRVVLTYPRYLLRLPYGAKRNPLESFAFEECSAIPKPDELLWGNPAFVCARAMIRNRQGQQGGEAGFFSDIPAFAFDRDGEQVLQPGTETVLNEAQANALVSLGITPLIGFRQRQGIRLFPIVTLSEHV